ncbi:MAG: hypothetical protein GF350_05520 [Chitinivibrionales bacterium]|nr:hypothetical protein [Chitinivibrionales bacterium]
MKATVGIRSFPYALNLVIALFIFTDPGFAQKAISINVHYNTDIAPLYHMWRCSGHASGGWTELAEAYMQRTMYMGGIPHKGFDYLRIHQIIKSARANDLSTYPADCDFGELDEVIDRMLDDGIRPHMELMTGPRDFPVNYGSFASSQSYRDKWYNFIKPLAQHYVDRYGIDEVRRWLFQTDNEVGYSTGYAMKCMVEEAALHSIDDQLVYGSGAMGTNGLRRLLEYLYNNANIYTTEKPSRIDYVTAHVKGPYWEAVDWSKEMTDIIENEFPDYAGKVKVNDDESDPISGHQNPIGWRIGPSYAAMVACRIWACQTAAIEDHGVDYLLMNQDNAFLHDWAGRSLMALFTGPGFDDNEGPFEQIKKCALNVYELMSLTGDMHIATDGYTVPPISASQNIARVDALATKDDDGRVAVMVFNNKEYYVACPESLCTVSLSFSDIPYSQAALVHYRIDEHHSNAYRVWEELGGPVEEFTSCTDGFVLGQDQVRALFPWQGPEQPDAAQFAEIRKRMELETIEPPEEVSITGGSFTTQFELPMPGVSMVILAPKPAGPPQPASSIKVDKYDGTMTGEEHYMIRWDPSPSRYIKTYEVLYSETENGAYRRVNEADQFTTTFLHLLPQGTPQGFYIIVPVDYWGRKGEGVTMDGSVAAESFPMQCSFQSNSVYMESSENRLILHNTSPEIAHVKIFNALGRNICNQVLLPDSEEIIHRGITKKSEILFMKISRSGRNKTTALFITE